jgi:hypothetical protein
MDGPLLWLVGGDTPGQFTLDKDYRGALIHFHDTHVYMRRQMEQNASIVGYVDRHDSRFVIRLLHLLMLPDDHIRRAIIEADGPFEGLNDDWLFSNLLDPGQRSALMVQQSPHNKSYRNETGLNYEIAFFYLNVGTWGKPHIVRVEIPMWVALKPQAVDEVHTLLLEQCKMTGGYPYVLTRADELAVVSSIERQQLNNMINIELLRNQQSVESSPKLQGKGMARQHRQQHQSSLRKPF